MRTLNTLWSLCGECEMLCVQMTHKRSRSNGQNAARIPSFSSVHEQSPDSTTAVAERKKMMTKDKNEEETIISIKCFTQNAVCNVPWHPRDIVRRVPVVRKSRFFSFSLSHQSIHCFVQIQLQFKLNNNMNLPYFFRFH